MTVSNKFFHNLEVDIKVKDEYFSDQCKILQGGTRAGSFSSKVKVRGMASRYSEHIPELAVLKELL